MSIVRDCPACGRGFIKGRRVLFPMKDGRLVRKLVCLKCSSGAERIVTHVSAKPCIVPSCPNPAHVCSRHAVEEIEIARRAALSTVYDAIWAQIMAYRLVIPKDNDDREILCGRLEGLESALAIMRGGDRFDFGDGARKETES